MENSTEATQLQLLRFKPTTPSFSQIKEAQETLQGITTKTEVRRLDWLYQLDGIEVFAKFEHTQKTGSFKIRGAYNRLWHQDKDVGIVAASAGNHGLAIAAAGQMLGINPTIYIPTTTSHIKKERIANFHPSMVIQGTSLEESTQFARETAEEKGWDFISPYNDPLIIAGQGTVALEFLDQISHLDKLIVPVGGGGLIVGAAIAAKKINPRIQVIGVEPVNYASVSTSLKHGAIRRVPNFPTFADGLAVNMESHSITFDLIQRYVDEVITVSEEEIAAASLTLLYRESQLVEPSGAVSLAAILSKKLSLSDSKIGLILSGGNVSTATLSKLINFPFKNEHLLKYLNFVGEKVENKTIIRGVFKDRKKIAPSRVFDEQHSEILEDIKYLRSRFTSINSCLDAHEKKLCDYLTYCSSEKLMPSTFAILKIQHISDELRRDVEEQIALIDAFQYTEITSYSRFIISSQQAYRTMLTLLASLDHVLDWRSASYNQSLDPQFFGVESQSNLGCNYNRYESVKLSNLEQQTCSILGVNSSLYSLFHTSSGMAAYTLIESFLLRRVLHPGDTILVPHYIYFETDEQISKLSSFKIERAVVFKQDEILSLIIRTNPRVVFLDPMTNDPDLRMPDITAIINEIDSLSHEHDLYIVIDGTMVAGAHRSLLQRPLKNPKLHLLYYESCSKYLQLGVDNTMAGLTVVPVEFQAHFERARRNSGTILYDQGVSVFPKYSIDEHQFRMTRFTRNAQVIADIIDQEEKIADFVCVNFPLLDRHPDVHTARRLPWIGGILTFFFKDQTLNHRDSLNALIEVVIDRCKAGGIPISKGVSFGFSIPRISAASAMAENAPPFLRLSSGDRSIDETLAFAKVLVQAFFDFKENMKSIIVC